MDNRSPIRKRDLANLRKILLRAFTRNQIGLLLEIENNSKETISSMLKNVSKNSSIPISTLKSCAKVLKELNLITFGFSKPAELTDSGIIVSRLVKGAEK